MAKISTYSLADEPLQLSDRLIGTEAPRPIPSSTPLATRNFSLGELLQLFSQNFPAASLQAVLNTGNTATQNITLIGNIESTSIEPTNIKDILGSEGATFQFLSKAVGGINWVDLPISNLQDILNTGNTATQDLNLFGNLSATRITPENIQDDVSSIGLIGQVLSKSASGIRWINIPSSFTAGLNDVLLVGNTATNDINLTGNIYSTLITPVDIKDKNSSIGTDGQVLTKKTVGFEWEDTLTNPITGTLAVGQVAFGTTTNVIGGDNGLFWNNTDKRLGVGATPATNVRLDVRAQGALSTDIAFRVRNSADTFDIIRVNGIGEVFVGLGAGRLNTGLNNSFFGFQAGFFNTTGANNSFFGQNAGFSNTTGGNNSFFGFQAGLSNTTGANNAFFGRDAGVNNTTGVNNAFFGQSAGRFIADGTTGNTISNNSLFIGFNSKALANNQTNQIVIGHDAIGAGSNTATIGNTSIVDTVLRGRVNIQQYATGSRPAYVKGALIYDSTLSKLVVGGATGWEVVTSL